VLDLITDAAAALEGSPLGAAMRGAKGWYPAANVAHVFGLVLLVGGIGVLDLRIAGLGRQIPLLALSRLVTPIAVVGLLVLLASGFLLLSADAGPLVRSTTFRIKMLLLAVGVVNALVFRRLFGDFDEGREPPIAARFLAVASICLWLTVGALGRLIAYS
jgi:hypothetical protein